MAYINKPRKKRENKPKEDKAKMIYDTVYNTGRWRKLRESMLMIHPLCQNCMKNLATEVHHIKPISDADDELGMMDLGFDTGNLMTLCTSCHDEIHRKLKKGDKDA